MIVLFLLLNISQVITLHISGLNHKHRFKLKYFGITFL